MLIVINYGGGTNSTALIIEAILRGSLSAATVLVVFADTGSERPETYAYLTMFAAWLKERGINLVIVRWHRRPARTWTYRGTSGALRIGQMLARHAESRLHPLAQAVVKKPEKFVPKPKRWEGADFGGMFIALHEDCERFNTIPSRAFGFAGCTTKWKQHPADDYCERWALYQRLFGDAPEDQPVERWIGYDADEPGRVARMAAKAIRPDLWKWRAPLVEWDMGRDECTESIRSAGLPLPGKSACFVCPSTTKNEIDVLGSEHPDLLERALKIERAAIEAGNVKSRGGLGGRLNWGESLTADRKHLSVLQAAGVDVAYLERRREIRKAFADAKVLAEAEQESFDAVADGQACGCYDG